MKKKFFLINKNHFSIENDNIGLKAPSTCYNKIISHVLDIFEEHFDKLKHKKNFILN